MKWSAGVALSFICAIAPAAGAQERSDPAQVPPTLEQLMAMDVERVFGASRFQQSVLEAPASVTIVTHDDIDRFGYRTLADILRVVRGFYVSSDRNYSYLGVRGFSRPGDYNTRVLLLIDGHRVNDNIYDQALIGTEFPLDVDLIERVEVVRGASSSLYGTSAFFGVVNVITKRPADVGRFSGSAELASLGTRRVRATAGRAFASGASAALSFTTYHADGQRQLFYPELRAWTRTGGVSSGLDSDRFSQVFAAASAGGWKAQTAWGSRVKGIPTGAFGTALDDDRSRTRDLRGYVNTAYDRTWAGTALQWRAAYDRYHYDGTYALDLPDGPDQDPYDDLGRGDWWSTEATLRRHVTAAHHVTAGVEVRQNVRQDQRAFFPASGTVFLDDRRRSRVWAVFAQDEFRLAPRVLLNAGLRNDHSSLSRATTSPRAALIVSARPDAAIKLTYGEAFRAPNTYELFYYTPGGAPLQAERTRSSELIWEQYISRRVRVEAVAFVSRVRNLISQQAGGGTTPLEDVSFRNLESTTTQGVGFEGEARLTDGFNLQANYQFNVARLRGSAEPLSNSPRHLGRAAVTRQGLAGHVVASTEVNVVGRRLALNGTSTPAYALWNASLRAPSVLPHLSLQFDGRNLLNRAYADPGAEEHRQAFIPQDGRTVRLRAAWQF